MSDRRVPQFVPWIGEDEYKRLAPCFHDNWITEGPKSAAFLERVLALTGAKYGVLAPNGTLALYLALSACGIGPGDEVIVPDFTFIASANSIVMARATPVFIDVDPDTFQFELGHAEAALTENTKAIMPVHIYGTAAQMGSIMAFAKQHELMVIEDAAQAIDIRYRGTHAGTFGDAGAFSFFADKTITTGEGGMVVTNDETVYEKLRYLRNQGRIGRGTFIHPEIGYNFRMTDIQTAVGLAQLDKLADIIREKKRVLKRYTENLGSLTRVRLFGAAPGADFVPFRVGALCEKAHDLMQFLETKGVEPRSFFYPLHRQPAFSHIVMDLQSKGLPCQDEDFPNAIFAYENGICLPTFPTLSNDDIDYVSDLIKEFYR